MVVGSPGNVAVNGYDAITMAPVKNIHHYCKHWNFVVISLSVKQLILHIYSTHKNSTEYTNDTCVYILMHFY